MITVEQDQVELNWNLYNIKFDEKKLIAFEVYGQLYQFCQIQFDVMKGAAWFQCIIDKSDIFTYLDNISVCGKSKEEYNIYFRKFINTTEMLNLTYNHDKYTFSATTVDFLDFTISGDKI